METFLSVITLQDSVKTFLAPGCYPDWQPAIMTLDPRPSAPPPTVVAFGPKGNYTLAICPVEWSVYNYRSLLQANVIMLIMYAIATNIHVFQGLR